MRFYLRFLNIDWAFRSFIKYFNTIIWSFIFYFKFNNITQSLFLYAIQAWCNPWWKVKGFISKEKFNWTSYSSFRCNLISAFNKFLCMLSIINSLKTLTDALKEDEKDKRRGKKVYFDFYTYLFFFSFLFSYI